MSLASGTDRPHTPSSKSRYQRLHHHHHHHDDDVVVESSLDAREMTASPSTIFRGRGISTATQQATAWTALSSTEDVTDKERRSDEEDEDDDDDQHRPEKVHNRSHQSLVSGLSLSPNTSREWNDDLQEEDDMIRRYHHVIHTRVPTLPAEFSGKEARGNATGIGAQLWAALTELRQGARQRRAARLLNPNTSRHDFFQTWFCDATNQGIALAAALTAAWLLMGMILHISSPGYWWTGLMLFGIRVSARTVYQALVERKRRRKRNMSALTAAASAAAANNHSSASMELTAGNPNVVKSTTHYRDQQEASLTIPMV